MRPLRGARPGALILLLIGAPGAAYADSAVGISLGVGNELNPSGLIPGVLTDSRGLSAFISNSRSPSGYLYPKPFLLPELTQDKDAPDWWRSGWTDAGVLYNASNTHAATFSEYGDWSSGVIGSFGMYAENRKTANYVSLSGSSIGRDDQSYSLSAGRFGVFRFNLGFVAAPHMLAANATAPWNGIGTSDLTLTPGTVPGAATAAQVRSALSQTLPANLGFSRTTTGMALSYTPSDTWELFLNAANEWRDGNKPIGSAFSFPGRGAAELVQPVKYRTTDLSIGSRYKGEELQANVTYAGSFFRNDFAALTWDNPGLGTPAGSFAPRRGRIALAPNNDYHTIKADAAWILSDVQVAANASYAIMRQDDDLLPPAANSGRSPVDLANWNTIAALSRRTAKAGLDAVNGFVQFRWNADRDLALTLVTRYRNEDNKTDYSAFNPLTGEYGYMGLDGALSRIYTPAIPGTDVPIRNIPFQSNELKITSKADYRAADHTRIALSITHDEIDRANREVLHSRDNSVETDINTTGYEWGTVRFSYSYADRDGSSYVTDPYIFARSSSLPGYVQRPPNGDAPYALNTFRKYDVAGRREHTAKLQSNFVLTEDSDFQLTGSYRRSDYDADYGLRALDTYDANVSYTDQISNALTLTAFYGFQFHWRTAASVNAARSASSDASAGGPNYPAANSWQERVRDTNHVFGINAEYRVGKFSGGLDYTYSQATSDFAYSFAGLGAISSGLTPLEAGFGFPDQQFAHHILEAKLTWTYSEQISLRWYYRLEHETLNDFHYTGLTNLVGNNIFIAAIPQDYTAHIIGFFTQYRM